MFFIHIEIILKLGDFGKLFSSKFFCRFCKADKTLTHTLVEEDQTLLRNVSNYIQDVETNNFSLTGVSKYSILNNINSFRVTTLNFRKQNFSYGELEQKNISPPIKKHNLSKFHLKMSARQMMCFAHFFPLMIGDLIPEG